MLPGSGRSTFITVLAPVWIPQLRGASGSSEGLNVGLSYWFTTAALVLEEVGGREMDTLKNLAQIHVGLEMRSYLL